jgi:TPR repeat protein
MRKGREIGPWTDIWALGLIAHPLLVGRPYWQAEAVGELYGDLLSNCRAAALYDQACSGGNSFSCDSFGYLYDTGNGVAQDHARETP